MYKKTWFFSFLGIWCRTYQLKRRRKKENWSDAEYYRAMYSMPRLVHEIEGDKFAQFRDPITAEILKDKATARVLDFATGRGYQARNLWARGYQHVSACDFVDQRIAQAKELNADTNIEFSVNDIRKTNFAAASFDAITISVALHDATVGEVEEILSECSRLLKPGGRLIILEPRFLGDIAFAPYRKFYAFAADFLDESVNMPEFVAFDLAGRLRSLGFRLIRRQKMWYNILCLYTFEK